MNPFKYKDDLKKQEVDTSKWIEVEGSPCFNLETYKFCICKKTLKKSKILRTIYDFGEVQKGLVYLCAIENHHVIIFGRGCGIIHYVYWETKNARSCNHYSLSYRMSKTNFKKYFKVIEYDGETHTLNEAQKKYGYNEN